MHYTVWSLSLTIPHCVQAIFAAIMDRAIRKLSFRTKKVEHDKGESVPGAVDLSSICIGPR